MTIYFKRHFVTSKTMILVYLSACLTLTGLGQMGVYTDSNTNAQPTAKQLYPTITFNEKRKQARPVGIKFGQKADSFDYYLNDFRSIATFNGIQFDSLINFTGAVFYENCQFTNAHFNNGAMFHQTVFEKDVDFVNVYIKGNIDFNAAIFKGYADFFYLQIPDPAHTYISFCNASFYGEVNFDQINLPTILNFERMRSVKEIDLTKAIPYRKGRCQIWLTESDISKIKLNYEVFQLCFPPQTRYEQKISTYEKLLKKFEDDGFKESYKQLDIEYKSFKNKEEGNYFLDFFLKKWWNYGYNKERVLYWSFGILFIFTLINIRYFDHLQNKVYKMNYNFYNKEDFGVHRKRFGSSYDLIFDSPSKLYKNFGVYLWYFISLRFINSLMYTAILFFGLKLSLENFKKFSGGTLYVWFIYLTGLFCLGYIVNIIIVK